MSNLKEHNNVTVNDNIVTDNTPTEYTAAV